LAKTLSVKTLSQTLNAKFQRIQFTPDLLPADIIGTLVYNPKDGQFTTKKGPIFSNIILADEINRATPKAQSALLEAMEEQQVTVEGESTSIGTPGKIVDLIVVSGDLGAAYTGLLLLERDLCCRLLELRYSLGTW